MPVPGIKPLTLVLQEQQSTPTPQGTHQFWVLFQQFLNFMIVTGHKNCDSGVAQLNDIIFDSNMSIEHITIVDFVKNNPKIIQTYEF